MLDIIKDAFGQLRNLVVPSHYFSWQTILLLSIFSWAMAALAELTQAAALTVNFIGTCSWIFLTVAIWWALYENPIVIGGVSISPWITAAVLCLFVFRPWTDARLALALSAWPLVATLLVAIPYFLSWELDLRLPGPGIRQDLAVVLLLNLLLSCWIMFHFRVQSWFDRYPSLLSENLDRSAFIYELPRDTDRVSQGEALLENAASNLGEELNNTPWPRVERALLNVDALIDNIAEGITLGTPSEVVFWSLDAPSPRSKGPGYQLQLRANWLGPTAEQNGYYFAKECSILPKTPQARAEGEPSTPVAEVACVQDSDRVVRELPLAEAAPG